MTITMYINYAHMAQLYFLLRFQNTWLTREYKLCRLARLLLLAKEAENANSHNSQQNKAGISNIADIVTCNQGLEVIALAFHSGRYIKSSSL